MCFQCIVLVLMCTVRVFICVTCEVTGKVSDVLYVVSTRVHVSVGKLILKLY